MRPADAALGPAPHEMRALFVEPDPLAVVPLPAILPFLAPGRSGTPPQPTLDTADGLLFTAEECRRHHSFQRGATVLKIDTHFAAHSGPLLIDDWKVLLALFALWHLGEIDATGEWRRAPSLRRIMAILGQHQPGGDVLRNTRRALDRIRGTAMTVRLPRADALTPLIPRAVRDALGRTASYTLAQVEFDITTDREFLTGLSLSPALLDTMAQPAGVAWVPFHAFIRCRYQLGLRLMLAAAEGFTRGTWCSASESIIPTRSELDAIFPQGTLATKNYTLLWKRGIEDLCRLGVLTQGGTTGTRHTFRVHLSWHPTFKTLHAYQHCVGGLDDKTLTLLAHLTLAGVSAPAALEWVETKSETARHLLQRMWYVRLMCDGVDEYNVRVQNWGGWLRTRVEGGWSYVGDAKFLAWCESQRSAESAPPLTRVDGALRTSDAALRLTMAPGTTLLIAPPTTGAPEAAVARTAAEARWFALQAALRAARLFMPAAYLTLHDDPPADGAPLRLRVWDTQALDRVLQPDVTAILEATLGPADAPGAGWEIAADPTALPMAGRSEPG